jgi:hypothetical protein
MFWPILGMIHSTRILYEPFVIALYSGNSKAKQSHEYLREFVAELNRIQEDGIIISGIRFKLCFKGFICDTLARAYIKSTVSHTAFKASERCNITGVKVERTTVYLQSNCDLRSDQSFRNFEDPDHHVGASPLLLIKPPINMISSFILDYMHLGFLGVMKKLIELFFDKLSYSSKNEISRRLQYLKQQIPDEFTFIFCTFNIYIYICKYIYIL